MKTTRKMTPMIRGIPNAIKLVLIDSLSVITMRKLTIVTVSVIIPIKSRCSLFFLTVLVGGALETPLG